MTMIIQHHEWGTYHHGTEMGDPVSWHELDSLFWTRFLSFMFFNRGFYSVFDAMLKTRHDQFGSMLAIFDCHATYVADRWVAKSSGIYTPVQELVNERDGKAICIILCCCNPRNQGRVTSNRSLVVHSRSSMNIHNMMSRRSKQIMHVPGIGNFVGVDDESKLEQAAIDIKQKARQ